MRCSGLAAYIFRMSTASTYAAQPTRIQHNYPNDPYSTPCWITQFFDQHNSKTGNPHEAEDVKPTTNGQKTTPPIGTPVYAAEDGKVSTVISGKGPDTWPGCNGKNPPSPANSVRITNTDSSDGQSYTTRYVHITPCTTASCSYNIALGQSVGAGREIGTIDDSGCQSVDQYGNRQHHVHIQRRLNDTTPVNFHLPCLNDPVQAPQWFWDGVTDDGGPDEG